MKRGWRDRIHSINESAVLRFFFNYIHLNRFSFLSVSALIGSVFSSNQEPAYANLRMFQALGFTIAYMYSKFLCEYIKLYIAAAFVVGAVSLQTIVEIRVKRSDKKTIQGSKAEEAINYWDCLSLFFFFTVKFRYLIRPLRYLPVQKWLSCWLT